MLSCEPERGHIDSGDKLGMASRNRRWGYVISDAGSQCPLWSNINRTFGFQYEPDGEGEIVHGEHFKLGFGEAHPGRKISSAVGVGISHWFSSSISHNVATWRTRASTQGRLDGEAPARADNKARLAAATAK